MRVVVLGGDGFCGWPTALHLASHGHDTVIVDNLVRRNMDVELEVQSLTPIASITDRVRTWNDLAGPDSDRRPIEFVRLDAAQDYDRLLVLLIEHNPDSIVHFAEQRAAPYSMKSSWHKRYTVDNNVNATHNLLAAVVEAGINPHIVHLGTMGVYGYDTAGVEIPEGYLPVQFSDKNGEAVNKEILYPTSPGSVYHMTKSLDQLLFQLYAKNDKLKITDLHQGIVWGTQTEETRLDDKLVNRFDYDGDFGTVLNRFLMQAAIGYPLTVHGTGGQTRAFIHIQDTVQCVRLAIESADQVGERVRVMNQMTQCFRVRELAELISRITGAQVSLVDNPRNESAENDLMVSNKHLLELGLTPITLEEGLLEEVIEVAGRYSDRCDLNKVPCVSFWNHERELEYVSHHLGEDSREALASGDSEDPGPRAART